ncbi:Sas10/Utp3/C1D family-domain-containing protein [Staphylotrichum tortipilum]|uniref:Exosome complex protein n=1 Tax=Staphylotrichum tortipilum TaxID=2831512 RepID=A0AAN6RY90_9PEZI|nr:Sas10/Utp3/C1D family-domain-containing protein [Staphylotrichum longicolle]
MDVSDVTPQLDQLEDQLNSARDALEPLLGDIGDISAKLPLLDKAKLYVLVSYTIESLLFSALRLNGVETKNHAIFTELTRVKQYMDKIQKVENPPVEREKAVNTEVAARFLRSDLGDNKDIKAKLTELIAKERGKAAAMASEKKRLAGDSTAETAGGGQWQNHVGLLVQLPAKYLHQTPIASSTPNNTARFIPSSHHPPNQPKPNPIQSTHNHIMPRQSRSSARPAPSRPTVPARSAPAPTQQQQTRPAATYAAPTSAPTSSSAMPPQAPAAPVSQGPGLLGQMASTAAGVAIGSSIGHVVGNGISSLWGGSSSSAPEAAAPVQAQAAQNNSSWGNNCAGATEQFTKCMDDHSGNMQICGWYLEQLKACQTAASQF